MAEEDNAKWRHSIIEICVVSLLALFGGWAEIHAPQMPYLRGIIAAAVVIGVLLILRFLDRFLETRPMPIGTVGKINGVWLDAIYDEKGDLMQASFLEMSCSQSKGFEVNGSTYDVYVANDGALRVVRPSPGDEHHFVGDGGYSKVSQNCCSYYYEGRERKYHKGSGFYAFRRNANKRLLFDGGFGYWNLEDGKITAARLVQGEKFKGKKKEYATAEQRVALVEQFLRDRSRKYKCSPESGTRDAA